MKATEIAARLATRAEEVAQHLLPGGKRIGAEWCVGSVAGEAGKSLKIRITGERAGVWQDFAGGDDDRGDLIGLWQAVRNVDLKTACAEALAFLGIAETRRKPVESKRAVRMPALRAPTLGEVIRLAEVRRLPFFAGIELARLAGQLWCADMDDAGEPVTAWIVTDSARRNAQARRLDGKPWRHIGGNPKAKTLRDSKAGWPIGAADIGDKPCVALVEGGPDFLAAWSLIWWHELTNEIAPVCICGASQRIHDEALPLFRGKRVRIFCHNDDNDAGMRGGHRWAAQLRTVGATVDGFRFDGLCQPNGDPCGDLNDLATWPAESWCDQEEVERDAAECGSEGPTLMPSSERIRFVFAGMTHREESTK